jgi:small subunit ribosomal protein S20
LANHKSAKKRARQDLKRRARNRAIRSDVRGRVKAVRSALEAGDVASATEHLKSAERALCQASTKGVMKKTTASRSVSRLARAVHLAGS